MFDLEGFTAFNFEEGVPYVSITPNGVTFNKSVTLKLNCPEYVQLLINANSKQLALVPCTQDTQNAVVFYRPKSSGILSVRWNARDLLNTIEFITGWRLKDASYRVDGMLIPEAGVMIFDLNKATALAYN
ncbi:MAG: hypothetical protein ACI3YU_00060 [Segatella copri]